MTQEGVSKDDVKVPEGDLGREIQAGFDNGQDLLVTIISAMGEEQVRQPFLSLWNTKLNCARRPSPSKMCPRVKLTALGCFLHTRASC